VQVHPEIAALRSDRAPQRQAQGAMKDACDAWRAEPGAADMMRELEAFGAGAPLESCAQLEAVFTAAGEAERLAGLLSRHFARAIAANPYGHPPFRNGFEGNAASLLLARSGRAQLLIQSREPASFKNDGYGFSDALRYDAVIGGRATARILRITRAEERSARFADEPIELQPGCRLAFDLASETLLVERVERRLVTLRLLRQRENPLPGREYVAATGELAQQCAGNLATSRQEAIIALLGRMGRTDAVPEITRVALGQGDASLRWQAVREAIALDSGAGFRTLGEVARKADDPLAAPAGALRAQLVETYPQLLALEAQQCPA
jgi:hypothetical protein